MCIAVPGEVVKVYNTCALVDFNGFKLEVNTGLIEKVVIGDFLLVHAGCAIEKTNEQEAKEALNILKNAVIIND